METRETIFRMRMTASERRELRILAIAAGLTESAFVRRVLGIMSGRVSEEQGRLPSLTLVNPEKLRKCTGRKVDPTYRCHNAPNEDYDQCKGCSIADHPIRQEEKKKVVNARRY